MIREGVCSVLMNFSRVRLKKEKKQKTNKGIEEEEGGKMEGGESKDEEKKLIQDEEKLGKEGEGGEEGGIDFSPGNLETGIERSILSSPEVMFGSYDEKSDIWVAGVYII